MIAVDLNSDLGEGFGAGTMGDDEAMLAIVSSANVACGFHAGDPSTMRAVCAAAARRGVSVGAHVAYDDVSGFGRRDIDIDPGELRDAVTYQIGALDAMAKAAGTSVSYVKPHGALYNRIVHDEVQAGAVVAGVLAARGVAVGGAGRLPLMGLPGSVVLRLAADAGLRPVGEGFVDRAYRADGTLVPRREPESVLQDVDAIVSRTIRFARDGVMTCVDGAEIELSVESMCVHGDTPGAVLIAAAVRAALEAAGVAVLPFVSVT